MYLMGKSNRDIARALGVSDSAVSQTVHLPEFQERVKNAETYAATTFIDQASEFALQSGFVLSEIMLDESSKPGERAAAAGKLLTEALKIVMAQNSIQNDGDSVPVVLERPQAKAMEPTIAKPEED